MSEQYCKIYIDYPKSGDELTLFIHQLVNGKRDHSSIYTDKLWIIVNSNDAFMDGKIFEEEDNFLYSKFFLDIESVNDEISDTDFKETTSVLLEKLWESEMKAVASCDFEEELPRFGGYNYEERLRLKRISE